MAKLSTRTRRRSKLPRLLKKMEAVGRKLNGIHLDAKDDREREAQLKLLGAAEIARKEGIE